MTQFTKSKNLSGSGKTTMLNVLTQRNLGQLRVEGEVRVNGMELGKAIQSISAYVQQDDLFFSTLKVKEHLYFQVTPRLLQITEIVLLYCLGLSKTW